MSILFVRREEEITEGPATVSLPGKAGAGLRPSDGRPRTSGKSSLISRIRTSYPGVIWGSVAAVFSASAHFSHNAGVVEERPLQGRVLSATHVGPLGPVAALGLKPHAFSSETRR
jgi:hypothetical protein